MFKPIIHNLKDTDLAYPYIQEYNHLVNTYKEKTKYIRPLKLKAIKQREYRNYLNKLLVKIQSLLNA